MPDAPDDSVDAGADGADDDDVVIIADPSNDTADDTVESGPAPGRRIRPVFGAGRIEARERAVLLSYEAEQRALAAAVIIADQPLGVDEFTSASLLGTERDRESIDARIERLSTSWPLHRMPAIDRAILRQGIWELTDRDEISVAVVINEAVELAHQYSTDESGRFVNGILSAVAREVRGHG